MDEQIRTEIYMFRLQKRLSNSLKDLSISFNESMPYEAHITVTFKNGHKLTTTEGALNSDQFLAACYMVYDLPGLFDDT